MDKEEFQSHMLSAYDNGQLLTIKHDPNLLNFTWNVPRSVLSQDLADNLREFILAGNYTVEEYDNSSHPNSPKYWVIAPDPASSFSIPASGVEPFDPYASTALDRLVAVSGVKQGLHLYGEDSAVIQRKASVGSLIYIHNL